MTFYLDEMPKTLASDIRRVEKFVLTVKLELETLLQKLNKNITFGIAGRQDLKNKFISPFAVRIFV